jgi:hypothetical protein
VCSGVEALLVHRRRDSQSSNKRPAHRLRAPESGTGGGLVHGGAGIEGDDRRFESDLAHVLSGRATDFLPERSGQLPFTDGRRGCKSLNGMVTRGESDVTALMTDVIIGVRGASNGSEGENCD